MLKLYFVCEIKLHFKNYRDGMLMLSNMTKFNDRGLIAKNLQKFEMHNYKNIFVHIFVSVVGLGVPQERAE